MIMINKIKGKLAGYTPQPLGIQKHFSVLLPLIELDGEWHVLYEKRSRSISQPGETSFPGGTVEAGESYEAAALRETQEELNIKRENISLIGEIDYIAAPSHIIRCFVGELVNLTVESLQPNEEVEKVFTIPVTYFVENEPEFHPVNLRVEHADDFPFELISNGNAHKWSMREQSIPFYRLSENFLWGYTAHLTHRFSEILQDISIEDRKND
ncbi:MAG: CoA pyrophosphatase [Alkalibacterium sp.]|nr:CoA pyrophosphatase [Alkalibacterium sp.]